MKNLLLLSSFLFCSFIAKSQTAEELSIMAEKKAELKDYQYAMVLIDKAIALEPRNQWYYLEKAEIEFNLTGPREALKVVESAILLDKTSSEPYNSAGRYYQSGGIADSAIIMFNLAIKYAKNDTIKNSYIMNRGVAKSSVRDYKGAVEDMEISLAFNPNSISTLNNIAACYNELGMKDKGIMALKKIITLNPKFIGTYVNLGFIYSATDSLDLAIDYFNKAHEIDPTDAITLNNRGYVYYKKGDYKNALSDINLSIRLYPTNSYAYRNLALVYIAMQKTSEACTALNYARDYGFEARYGPEVSELLAKHCK